MKEPSKIVPKNSFEKLLSLFDSDGKDWLHAGPYGDERRGCSSVVERDLAKVDVESSNLFTRSIFLKSLPRQGRLF